MIISNLSSKGANQGDHDLIIRPVPKLGGKGMGGG